MLPAVYVLLLGLSPAQKAAESPLTGYQECCGCHRTKLYDYFETSRSAGIQQPDCASMCRAAGRNWRDKGAEEPWFVPDSTPCGQWHYNQHSFQEYAGKCGGKWCDAWMKVRVRPLPAMVGETITVEVTVRNIGHQAGAMRFVLDRNASVDWGDGTKTPDLETVDSYTQSHVYQRPGTYFITTHVGGEFKWQGEGEGCSYGCNVFGHAVVVVRPARPPSK